MDPNSIDQENEDLKQIELRSQKEVESIEKELLQLKRTLELKRANIKQIESEIEINKSKKQNLEAKIKEEMETTYSKNCVLIPSDTLVPVSSSFIQSFVNSHHHADGLFTILQIPSPLIDCYDSSLYSYYSSLKDSYGFSYDVKRSTGALITERIRFIFNEANHQQSSVSNPISKMIRKPFSEKKLLVFGQQKPRPFTSTSQPVEEEEDDFISFSSTSTSEDPLKPVISIITNQRPTRSIRFHLRQFIPSFGRGNVDEALLFVKKKLEDDQKSVFYWILYLKLFCCNVIGIDEETLHQIIQSGLSCVSNDPGFVLYAMAVICSASCSQGFVQELWDIFVSLVTNNRGIFTSTTIITVVKMVLVAYPVIIENPETIAWIRSQLKGEYIRFFEAILQRDRILPIIDIPHSCPYYQECLQLVKQYQNGERKPIVEVKPKDCEDVCVCGKPKEAHKPLFQVIRLVCGNTGMPFFSSFFDDLVKCCETPEATAEIVNDKLDEAVLSLLQTIPFLQYTKMTSKVFRDFITKVFHNLSQAMEKWLLLPSELIPSLPEESMVDAVYTWCVDGPQSFTWPRFYTQDWSLPIVPTMEEFRYMRSRLRFNLRNAFQLCETSVEETLLMLLYLSLECYYFGYNSFLERFHQMLRCRNSGLLWSLYVEVICNCPSLGLSKGYLDALYDIVKKKKLYLKETGIE